MKRLFYASAAVLMLAIAYHLGASTATAQSRATPVGLMLAPDFVGGTPRMLAVVMDQNGDLYYQKFADATTFSKGLAVAPATRLGNFWTGARKDSK